MPAVVRRLAHHAAGENLAANAALVLSLPAPPTCSDGSKGGPLPAACCLSPAHLLDCSLPQEETPMIYELRTYTLKQGSVPEVVKDAEHGRARHPQGRLRQARGLLGHRDRAAQPGDAPVELQRPQRAGAPARPSSARTRAGTASTCRSSAPTSCARTSGCSTPCGPRSRRRRRPTSTSCAAIAPGPAPPSNGWISSPARCRCARNIPRSSAYGPPRPASPTRSATSGRTPTSTRARRSRAESGKDPGWQEFIKSSTGLLDEMHSTIMLPAPHSPLK